jgi:hypothetical protein
MSPIGTDQNDRQGCFGQLRLASGERVFISIAVGVLDRAPAVLLVRAATGLRGPGLVGTGRGRGADAGDRP